jgi:ATP-binding cassette subfamily F protein uup
VDAPRQASTAEGSQQASKADRAAPRERSRGKLSYKDQRELEALPAQIEALEREQSELNALMSGPDYHRRGPDQIRADRRRSDELEALLLAKFERWEDLEQARA